MHNNRHCSFISLRLVCSAQNIFEMSKKKTSKTHQTTFFFLMLVPYLIQFFFACILFSLVRLHSQSTFGSCELTKLSLWKKKSHATRPIHNIYGVFFLGYSLTWHSFLFWRRRKRGTERGIDDEEHNKMRTKTQQSHDANLPCIESQRRAKLERIVILYIEICIFFCVLVLAAWETEQEQTWRQPLQFQLKRCFSEDETQVVFSFKTLHALLFTWVRFFLTF